MRLPLLVIHITTGMLGIVSGFVAIFLRKGSNNHRAAGSAFVISMLTMAAAAVCLAFMKDQMGNVLGGIFTIYLVATAWLTARRRNGETSIFDWGALLIPLAGGIVGWISGFVAAQSPTEPKDGVPAGMHFFMGSVMLLAAAGDVRMLLRDLSRLQRLTRHLWRMCFALFMASGSFFLGQGNKVFPVWVLKTNLLFIPALLPLVLLIFWLFRVRFTRAYTERPMSPVNDVDYLRT